MNSNSSFLLDQFATFLTSFLPRDSKKRTTLPDLEIEDKTTVLKIIQIKNEMLYTFSLFQTNPIEKYRQALFNNGMICALLIDKIEHSFHYRSLWNLLERDLDTRSKMNVDILNLMKQLGKLNKELESAQKKIQELESNKTKPNFPLIKIEPLPETLNSGHALNYNSPNINNSIISKPLPTSHIIDDKSSPIEVVIPKRPKSTPCDSQQFPEEEIEEMPPQIEEKAKESLNIHIEFPSLSKKKKIVRPRQKRFDSVKVSESYSSRNVPKSIMNSILKYAVLHKSDPQFQEFPSDECAEANAVIDFLKNNLYFDTLEKVELMSKSTRNMPKSDFKKKLNYLTEIAAKNHFIAKICADALQAKVNEMFMGVYEKKIEKKNHKLYLKHFIIFRDQFLKCSQQHQKHYKGRK